MLPVKNAAPNTCSGGQTLPMPALPPTKHQNTARRPRHPSARLELSLLTFPSLPFPQGDNANPIQMLIQFKFN